MRQKLSSDLLLSSLQTFLPQYSIKIAFSGGVDSHVLLDLAIQLLSRGQLTQVLVYHVNHHVHADSNLWAEHCQTICAGYGVDLTVLHVDYDGCTDNLESRLRDARYRLLAQELCHTDVLLTGHHQRDQAETLLLQLCRGAGIAGLSGMPLTKPLGNGQLVRPLLSVPYQAIIDYAREQEINYIHDPSNFSEQHDRNYIRHQVLPVLKARWPAIEQSIARSASHLGQQLSFEQDSVTQDNETVLQHGLVNIDVLKALPAARQAACLRYWLKQETGQFPNTTQLKLLDKEVIAARVDRNPQLTVNQRIVTRYKGFLHCIDPGLSFRQTELIWSGIEDLPLPDGMGVISATQRIGHGIAKHWFDSKTVRIKFRQGGEKCKVLGRSSRPLKKLLQEASVPPWLRDRIPLLYFDEQLAAIIGYWVCDGFQAANHEESICLNHQLV